MAQTVAVPGVGTIQFPDGMSQDDMTVAIQKNFPQLNGPSTQAPGDSQFLTDIKGLGNEAMRVGAKTITGLPLMAGDFFTALGKLATTGSMGSKDDYPSEIYGKQLDSTFAPPTTTSGKVSEGLSTLIASLGMPGPAAAKAAPAELTGADAVKAATLRDAQSKGLVVPPDQTTGAPMGARIANGWGGKVQTNAMATANNQPVINGLAATDIGLPPQASLTTAKIKGVIQKAADSGYTPLRDIGDIPVDQAHLDFVNKIGGMDRGASNISPTLGNPQIAELAEAMTPKSPGANPLSLTQDAASYDSGDMVDAISALRAKAADAYAMGNRTVGSAYKSAAGGFESLIDRHLQAQAAGGDDDAADMLNNFRQSRQTIAKAHDVIDALNPATGDVDARVMGQLLDDGDKLTGNANTIARFGRAFGDVAGRSKGDPNPVTAFQANTAGSDGISSALLNLVSRPSARNYALSPDVQNALLQPRGKTLSQTALDAVHANPAAFGALYEDGNNE